jgi:hypothetical protein
VRDGEAARTRLRPGARRTPPQVRAFVEHVRRSSRLTVGFGEGEDGMQLDAVGRDPALAVGPVEEADASHRRPATYPFEPHRRREAARSDQGSAGLSHLESSLRGGTLETSAQLSRFGGKATTTSARECV